MALIGAGDLAERGHDLGQIGFGDADAGIADDDLDMIRERVPR